MRIFVPVTSQDIDPLRRGAGSVALEEGRRVWGVSRSAIADRPDQDLEELEYDALQDAVFSALSQGEPSARATVLAGDVPDASLAGATEDGGAFGLRLSVGATLELASAHVTELDARGAEADDTDPALLWFDAAETAAALAYAEAPEAPSR